DDLPVRVLGGGANVLVSDAGWPGLIIINDTRAVDFDGSDVRVESGHGLMALARLCAARGLSGFEWAASVPGTVGGAIVGNAGAHGGDMAGNLVSARLIDAVHPEPYTLTAADLAYSYRTSALKRRADKRFVILEAVLHLTPDDPAAIAARIDAFGAYRKRTQPAGASLGSIFRNPPGDYAGRLIEACGLKGYAIGAAQVSPVHANFFINVGGRATAADYNRLIDHVRAVVRAQTGIDLEPEIERIGEF
ncbi:MAG: UDP-N-acetylmuramate dehydrogenase, partial [Anaerolinea sp.]|nr:UDP-N-acetylmuramate dehydrogenase [Anaerolinea sp.]